MPRTVPRGSVQMPQGSVFSPLGRFILDRLDRGVVLLDAQGCVIDANSHALHVIRSCSGISVRAGRLSFTDRELDQQLRDGLASQGTTVRNGRAVLATRVHCRGSEPYCVVIRALSPESHERKAAFLVLLFAPNGLQGISVEVLRRVYGLTPAQAAVARSLFARQSVEQTARALDLSLNTVRTHLKQIFTKCGVKSQAELLHLLALGPREL